MTPWIRRTAALGALTVVAGVLAPPASGQSAIVGITSVAPSSGPAAGGGRVTLHGHGFARVRQVLFGSVAGAHVHVSSSSALTVTAPRHTAGTVDVRVVVRRSGRNYESARTVHDHYAYVAPPAINKIAPTAVSLAGGRVTIAGRDFRRITRVTFAGHSGTGLRVTSTSSLSVVAPAHGAGLLDVHVEGGYGTSPSSTAARLRYESGLSVANLRATASAADAIGLSWTTDAVGVLIRRRAGSVPPADPTDGDIVADVPTPDESAADLDVEAGRRYAYAAFPYDANRNYGLPATTLGAVPDWSAATIPYDGDDDGDWRLQAVRCFTASSCVAVGSTSANGLTLPLASTWDGAAWHSTALSLPPGATIGGLNAVDCPSTTSCVAVGTLSGGPQGYAGLVATFDGRRWAISTISRPRSAYDVAFTAISCPATGQCTAIGSYSSAVGATLTSESLVDGAWIRSDLPLPAGVTGVTLRDLRCLSATTCLAVGAVERTDGFHPFLEQLSSGTWTASPLPEPPAGHDPTTSRILCSSTSCEAIGQYRSDDHEQHLFTDVLTAQGWVYHEDPALPSGVQVDEHSTHCQSDGACVLTGLLPVNDVPAVFALSPDGAWSQLGTLPQFAGSSPSLLDLDCVSGPTCFVVGYRVQGRSIPAVALRWTAGTWSSTPVPGMNGRLSLNIVSCPESGTCLAAGSVDTNAGPVPKIVTASGDHTSIEDVPVPPQSPSTAWTLGLSAFTCPTVQFCAMAGTTEVDPHGAGGPFLDVRSDGQWQLVRIAAPKETVNALACPTAGHCYGLGREIDQLDVAHPVLEELIAGEWHRAALPVPTGATDVRIVAASCPADGECVAVANDEAAGEPGLAVLTLHAGSWTAAQFVAPPVAGNTARVADVSCWAPGACELTGTYTDLEQDGSGGYIHVFASRRAGAGWDFQTLPSFGNDANPHYPGVALSCTSASACAIVTDYEPGGSPYPITYQLTPRGWYLRPLPAPAGSLLADIQDVACRDAVHCTAVGTTEVGVAAPGWIASFG